MPTVHAIPTGRFSPLTHPNGISPPIVYGQVQIECHTGLIVVKSERGSPAIQGVGVIDEAIQKNLQLLHHDKV